MITKVGTVTISPEGVKIDGFSFERKSQGPMSRDESQRLSEIEVCDYVIAGFQERREHLVKYEGALSKPTNCSFESRSVGPLVNMREVTASVLRKK